MKIEKIFGPPGTGKTRRLLSIMEDALTAGYAPERVAYLTFTVAARQEAKERARGRFGFTDEQLKWFRTLHSTAYELLGCTSDSLLGTDGLNELGKVLGYEFASTQGFTAEGLPTFGYGTGDRLLAFDHFRRHRLLSFEKAFREWPDERISRWEAKRFVEGYERFRRTEARLDFTDLLERGSVSLPCEVVFIDEAQDLSPLQWKTLWRFAANAERVYIAGDDDQAIYEWAGASPDAFLEQPGTVEVLPQSYRCPQAVTTLAKNLIERIDVRQPKVWNPREDPGEIRYAAMLEQMDVPDSGTCRYLVRNRKYAEQVTEYLRTEGEPHCLWGAPAISSNIAGAIVAWERLRRPGTITREELELVFGAMSPHRLTQAQRSTAREDGRDLWTAKELHNAGSIPGGMFDHPWYKILDRLHAGDEPFLRKVVEKYGAAGLLSPPRIEVTTIHGAKGAEADHVILLTDMALAVQKQLERDPDPELRVWYVGVTRARQTLSLIGESNPLF